MIELKNVYKYGYQGGVKVPILMGIDLQVDAGDYLAVIGPSGSGKSTLMNIIGMLDTPNEGEYLFDGKPVRRLGEGRLAALRSERIGFVFQSFMLIPRLTVKENVEVPLLYSNVGRKERRQRMEWALEQVGMLDKRKEPVVKLSGGQKQKAAIARALINDPDVLLADEPTGNLDQRSKEDILQIFQQLHRAGKTIILVTHDLEAADTAQRVVTMRNGEWAAPVVPGVRAVSAVSAVPAQKAGVQG